MMRIRIINGLICFCLLLVLSGCGNKGPLVLPEEEEKKARSNTG
jgi:predicted small lipoprotein YifL